jgi:hypothetical protein
VVPPTSRVERRSIDGRTLGCVDQLVVFVLVVAIGGAVGVGFGIVILAPRIGRLLDRDEPSEDTGDRPA